MQLTTGHRRQRAARAHAGAGSLGIDAPDISAMVRRLDAGFAFEALLRFQKASGLSLGGLADLLGIPPRTLVRRRAAGRLSSSESERLLRIAGIFEKAMALFEGNRSSAMTWLTSPKKALGGEAPLVFSRTEVGAREVEALIGRLEHGVFS